GSEPAFPGKLLGGMDQLQESTAGLTAMAGNGFHISEQGADRIRKVLNNMQQRLNELRRNLLPLEQVPKLGSHSYGQLVAEHDYRTAAGDPDSAIQMVERLREVLEEAAEALERAT